MHDITDLALEVQKTGLVLSIRCRVDPQGRCATSEVLAPGNPFDPDLWKGLAESFKIFVEGDGKAKAEKRRRLANQYMEFLEKEVGPGTITQWDAIKAFLKCMGYSDEQLKDLEPQ